MKDGKPGFFARTFWTAFGLGSRVKMWNTVSQNTVELAFQTAPLAAETGVEGIIYRLTTSAGAITDGKTGANGVISLLVDGNPVTLELFSDDLRTNLVATYVVTRRHWEVEASGTIAGVQRRLRQLGYQLGDQGAGDNGVSGSIDALTDEAILSFQGDAGLKVDGIVGPQTTAELVTRAGG
jgi:peptidoglycan hydrolase-like protein with peptidoglycan-binding domain